MSLIVQPFTSTGNGIVEVSLMVPDLGGVLFIGVLGQVFFGSGCLNQTIKMRCRDDDPHICSFFSEEGGGFYALTLHDGLGISTQRLTADEMMWLHANTSLAESATSSPEIFFRVGPTKGSSAVNITAVTSNIPLKLAVRNLGRVRSISSMTLAKLQWRAKKSAFALSKGMDLTVKARRKETRKLQATCQVSRRYVQDNSADAPTSVIQVALPNSQQMNAYRTAECPPSPLSSVRMPKIQKQERPRFSSELFGGECVLRTTCKRSKHRSPVNATYLNV